MADLNTSIGMYNYKKYLSSSNSDISELIKSHGIVNRHNMNWYQRFNRFGFIDPFNTMTTTKEYIFFTKPDLNIFNGTQLNPELEQRSLFFREMYKTHNHLLSQWQSSYGSSNNPFIALLSNAVSSELDLPTLSANTVETAETAYGYHMTYNELISQTHIKNYKYYNYIASFGLTAIAAGKHPVPFRTRQ